MKQPVNALDQPVRSSATQSIVQQKQTSASQPYPLSDEVPVGVLEIPVGVWGSRRAESISGLPGGLEVFAEETSTVIVFPYGAVIRLSMAVVPDQLMMVTNRKSRKQVFCRVVNVRKCPSAKSYAEIEFIQPMNDFWGAYVPQGTLKVTTQAEITAAAPERASKFDPIPSAPATIQASTEARFASAVYAKPPAAAPAPSEDFWSSSFPPEVICALAEAVNAPPDPLPTVRTELKPIAVRTMQAAHQKAKFGNKRSAVSWVRELLGSWPRWSMSTRDAANKIHWPRRAMALAGATVVALFMIGATGFYLLRDGAAKTDVIAQIEPAIPAVDLQSPQPESTPISVVPLPRASAKAGGFPGIHARELADSVSNFHPAARTTPSEVKILNEKLLAPHSAAGRSAAAIDQGVPPEVTELNPNTGADAIKGILAASRPAGGRMKEPQLVFKTVPIYPDAARRMGIEGKVTVHAMIDAGGKLTNMRVISGSPILQQASLDSLRNWKYEPAYLDDKPVQSETSVTLVFRLR